MKQGPQAWARSSSRAHPKNSLDAFLGQQSTLSRLEVLFPRHVGALAPALLSNAVTTAGHIERQLSAQQGARVPPLTRLPTSAPSAESTEEPPAKRPRPAEGCSAAPQHAADAFLQGHSPVFYEAAAALQAFVDEDFLRHWFSAERSICALTCGRDLAGGKGRRGGVLAGEGASELQHSI